MIWWSSLSSSRLNSCFHLLSNLESKRSYSWGFFEIECSWNDWVLSPTSNRHGSRSRVIIFRCSFINCCNLNAFAFTMPVIDSIISLQNQLLLLILSKDLVIVSCISNSMRNSTLGHCLFASLSNCNLN